MEVDIWRCGAVLGTVRLEPQPEEPDDPDMLIMLRTSSCSAHIYGQYVSCCYRLRACTRCERVIGCKNLHRAGPWSTHQVRAELWLHASTSCKTQHYVPLGGMLRCARDELHARGARGSCAESHGRASVIGRARCPHGRAGLVPLCPAGLHGGFPSSGAACRGQC